MRQIPKLRALLERKQIKLKSIQLRREKFYYEVRANNPQQENFQNIPYELSKIGLRARK